MLHITRGPADATVTCHVPICLQDIKDKAVALEVGLDSRGTRRHPMRICLLVL